MIVQGRGDGGGCLSGTSALRLMIVTVVGVASRVASTAAVGRGHRLGLRGR